MTPLVKAIQPAKFSSRMPRLSFSPLTSEAYDPPSLHSQRPKFKPKGSSKRSKLVAASATVGARLFLTRGLSPSLKAPFTAAKVP
jgi:hypothetical protein